MAKKVKCPICETMNAKEEAEQYKKRYYCPKCLEQEKIKETEKKKDIGNDDWYELYEYICELYGEKPTGRMFKQLGEFRNPPYNYTNKGMYLTLKYFYETLGNPVLKGSGLGIIPYTYDQAKNNFIENMEISAYNKEFETHEEPRVIAVNDNFNGRRNIRPKLISFDDIDKDVESED